MGILVAGTLAALAVTSFLGAADNSARTPGETKAPGPAESPLGDYVLQPQDILRVQVFQEDDINKQGEVSISQEHTIVLPLIGTVNLKGKTVRQTEELIRDLYNKDFIVNPQVGVAVLKYAERAASVLGAVNNAGRVLFPAQDSLTILQAISGAGGQSRLADLKRVRLTRKNARGESTTQEINVDALMKSGGEAILLEKGDVVFVPERTF
ncbi:MAG: polysaccharide biosynthesis/export family protein [Opitutaceae bacterium]